MATHKQENYEENIIRANIAINENKELEYRLDQSRQELDLSKKEIAQKDEKITRMEQVSMLRKQVKSFKKELKKQRPKKSNLPEKLRKLNKEAIKQYVKDTDDSISELNEFLDQMQED